MSKKTEEEKQILSADDPRAVEVIDELYKEYQKDIGVIINEKKQLSRDFSERATSIKEKHKLEEKQKLLNEIDLALEPWQDNFFRRLYPEHNKLYKEYKKAFKELEEAEKSVTSEIQRTEKEDLKKFNTKNGHINNKLSERTVNLFKKINGNLESENLPIPQSRMRDLRRNIFDALGPGEGDLPTSGVVGVFETAQKEILKQPENQPESEERKTLRETLSSRAAGEVRAFLAEPSIKQRIQGNMSPEDTANYVAAMAEIAEGNVLGYGTSKEVWAKGFEIRTEAFVNEATAIYQNITGREDNAQLFKNTLEKEMVNVGTRINEPLKEKEGKNPLPPLPEKTTTPAPSEPTMRSPKNALDPGVDKLLTELVDKINLGTSPAEGNKDEVKQGEKYPDTKLEPIAVTHLALLRDVFQPVLPPNNKEIAQLNQVISHNPVNGEELRNAMSGVTTAIYTNPPAVKIGDIIQSFDKSNKDPDLATAFNGLRPVQSIREHENITPEPKAPEQKQESDVIVQKPAPASKLPKEEKVLNEALGWLASIETAKIGVNNPYDKRLEGRQEKPSAITAYTKETWKEVLGATENNLDLLRPKIEEIEKMENKDPKLQELYNQYNEKYKVVYPEPAKKIDARREKETLFNTTPPPISPEELKKYMPAAEEKDVAPPKHNYQENLRGGIYTPEEVKGMVDELKPKPKITSVPEAPAIEPLKPAQRPFQNVRDEQKVGAAEKPTLGASASPKQAEVQAAPVRPPQLAKPALKPKPLTAPDKPAPQLHRPSAPPVPAGPKPPLREMTKEQKELFSKITGELKTNKSFSKIIGGMKDTDDKEQTTPKQTPKTGQDTGRGGQGL